VGKLVYEQRKECIAKVYGVFLSLSLLPLHSCSFNRRIVLKEYGDIIYL